MAPTKQTTMLVANPLAEFHRQIAEAIPIIKESIRCGKRTYIVDVFKEYCEELRRELGLLHSVTDSILAESLVELNAYNEYDDKFIVETK